MKELSARQVWMGVLARASVNDLDNRWKGFDPKPAVRFIRAPESGLAMVRGRTGGTGEPFNLGEITMTRCVVQLENGMAGFGYVKGRSKKHAELAAVFDGLLQDERHHDNLMTTLIQPLQSAWLEWRQQRAAEAASTKVDFFALIRGESA